MTSNPTPRTMVALSLLSLLLRPLGASVPPPLVVGQYADSTPVTRLALRPASDSAGDSTAAAHVVTLMLSGDLLATQLTHEIAAARAAGELPIVYLGDKTICQPCAAFAQALARPTLAAAFAKVRLLEVSPIVWQAAVPPLGYCEEDGKNAAGQPEYACDMPRFFTVDSTGHAVGKPLALDFGGNDADAWAKALAPQFTTFFAAARAAEK